CNYVDSGLFLDGRSCMTGLPNFVPDQLGYTPLKAAVPETGLTGDVQVYPNPVSHVLYFRVNNASSVACEIILCQASGQIVIQKKLSDHLTAVSTKDIAKGSYILLVLKDKKVVSRQVILIE